jgi:hypothetical protein
VHEGAVATLEVGDDPSTVHAPNPHVLTRDSIVVFQHAGRRPSPDLEPLRSQLERDRRGATRSEDYDHARLTRHPL